MKPIDRAPQLRIVREEEGNVPGIHHDAVYGALSQLVTFEMVDNPALMRAAIHDLYTELSLGDELLVQELGVLEESGAILRDDKMYLFVLFSVAGAHGLAEVTTLRDDIVNRRIDPERIVESMATLPLPEPLRRYLAVGLNRIHVVHSRPKTQAPTE
jgi:hypothetical protein